MKSKQTIRIVRDGKVIREETLEGALPEVQEADPSGLSDMSRMAELPNCGEVKLLSEILADAVALVRGDLSGYAKAADVEAARRWIAFGSIGPVSFEFCCEALGLNPEKTRGAILNRWSR